VTAARPFTSALGPREAVSITHAGFVPLRQVMGAAFFQTGGTSYYGTGPTAYPRGSVPRSKGHSTAEVTWRSAALNQARETAIGRMRDEAVACGADAVVGVRIHRGERDWVKSMVEYVVTGTAVRAPRYEIQDPPLLCTLSGQDVAKLVAYGHWPVGIAGGSTVAYVRTSRAQQRANPTRQQDLLQTRRRQQNRELRDWSLGLGEAYDLAMARVERDAAAQRAHGVVGLSIERAEQEREGNDGTRTYRDLEVTLHTLGTAIVTLRAAPASPPLSTILPLS
jgi:uncharacterized protein YbjQ (UPF0145 family)